MNPEGELARAFAERKLEEIRAQDIEDAKEPEWGSWIFVGGIRDLSPDAAPSDRFMVDLQHGEDSGVLIGRGATRVEALRHGIETVTKILEEKIRIEEEKS